MTSTSHVSADKAWSIVHGDCRERLRDISDASIDAVVTDPPYELGFMGKSWDATGIANDVAMWREVLRVLKPGGHVVAFGGSRTYHRMTCAIEDACFEIRDCLQWLYGTGFPKSLDVSKAIDRAAGAERKIVGVRPIAYPDSPSGYTSVSANSTARDGGIWNPVTGQAEHGRTITAPATPDAQQWSGWGTALKPAHEPIVLARKPLVGTVAANVLQYGLGVLNIDGCRIAHASDADLAESKKKNPGRNGETVTSDVYGAGRPQQSVNDGGRWPANVLLDEEAGAGLDEMSGEAGCHSRSAKAPRKRATTGAALAPDQGRLYADRGGASRFFYCAKASRAERDFGGVSNTHPTVKPLALMRWLVRLVTPSGGIVLDPFTGSGTTGIAALVEGFRFLGIEQEVEFVEIARRRLEWERAA